MHRDVRQATAGKCPKCGMELLPEGTRFGPLRHMIWQPHPSYDHGGGMAVVMPSRAPADLENAHGAADVAWPAGQL